MALLRLQDELIDRVRTGMRSRGWTQSRLSEHSGIPTGKLSEMLNGFAPATVRSWNKLLDALEEQ
jgi:hypothetical protein